ncbi:MAG: mechanosensitive ion channel, partial [Scytonema sp. PMC 1069.18]|nr:mechanosensitive ion channel [Scytonema sp. PMC 1069.18]
MTEWIVPLIFVIAGFLGGAIIERVFFKRLKKLVIGRKLPVGEILFRSLKSMPFIWCILGGFYGAIVSYPTPPDVGDLLRKIVTIAFLASVTLVLARLTAGLLNLYLRRTDGLSASLISNVAKISILVLGTLILLQTLGIQITPIITTLGVTGIAVGLALQDTLANLFAGFYLIFSKQVRTGDYVKLDDGHEGYVTDITWRNTTIKELSNNVIIVPNSKLSSAIFTNYHLPVKEITLTMNVGVSYDSDLEHVERVTVE